MLLNLHLKMLIPFFILLFLTLYISMVIAQPREVKYYRMGLNFRGTKLSRIADSHYIRGFYFRG